MNPTSTEIDVLLQIPAPCPGPLGLACDGPNLWVGCGQTHRVYGIDARQGTVFEEAVAPGKPYGMCVTGDALRVIVATGDDDRYLRRYIFGKDFKSESIACPELTGSFLAYDGDEFFISQRFDQRIVVVDQRGTTQRTLPTPAQVTGMTVLDGRIYIITTPDTSSKEYRLVRIDARRPEPEIVELAQIPFVARSLGFDGTRFWTHDRDERKIVAFGRPD
jgi:hypothetical protein